MEFLTIGINRLGQADYDYLRPGLAARFDRSAGKLMSPCGFRALVQISDNWAIILPDARQVESMLFFTLPTGPG